MSQPFQIANRSIGPGHPAFIIAEAGLNHNGQPEMAAQLIESAADAGADAIKFQTYIANELFAPDHPEYEKFERMQFSREVYSELWGIAWRRGIVMLSTPFDEASVDLLEALNAPAFKIGSGELTHLSFLRYVALKSKPMIVSTGMATLERIDAAANALRQEGAQFALLHCVSQYPCPEDDAGVRAVPALAERYGVPAGYSDHTTSDEAALAAVALGACVIEKHFTLSKNLPGWDHFFSYDPAEMKRLVEAIRRLERTLGEPGKVVQDGERPIEEIARRALYARRELKPGDQLTAEDVIIRRPLGPLPADRLDDYIGRKLVNPVDIQDPLRPEDFE